MLSRRTTTLGASHVKNANPIVTATPKPIPSGNPNPEVLSTENFTRLYSPFKACERPRRLLGTIVPGCIGGTRQFAQYAASAFCGCGSAHSRQEVVEREYDEVLNIRRQMGGEHRPKQPRSLAQLAKDRRNHIDHCGTLLEQTQSTVDNRRRSCEYRINKRRHRGHNR